MHLILLLCVLGIAWALRYTWTDSVGSWSERWHQTLMRFVVPPLLLLSSAIAILWMGPLGQMVWPAEDWLSYGIAIGWLGFAVLKCGQLAAMACQMLRRVRTYPRVQLQGKRARLINTPLLYSAQIGFWEPELVVSRGLCDRLEPKHLAAVLAHEQAHYDRRDTFWFFWLGWLRAIGAWLPQTELIWQNLLALRELRADRQASQVTDPLLVAEALLQVVQDVPLRVEPWCAPMSSTASPHRLTQRIEALIQPLEPMPQTHVGRWMWLAVPFLPLLTIPFHH